MAGVTIAWYCTARYGVTLVWYGVTGFVRVLYRKVRGDQAAHATLAPDRNPPGETAAGAPSSMPDSRFGTFASILDLWCPIRDFSDYFHISPSGFDNWLKRISAVIQD